MPIFRFYLLEFLETMAQNKGVGSAVALMPEKERAEPRKGRSKKDEKWWSLRRVILTAHAARPYLSGIKTAKYYILFAQEMPIKYNLSSPS